MGEKEESVAEMNNHQVLKEFNMSSVDDFEDMGLGNPVPAYIMHKMRDFFGMDVYAVFMDCGLNWLYRLTGQCPPEDSDRAEKLGYEADVRIRNYCFDKYGYFKEVNDNAKPYVVVHDQFKQVHKDVTVALTDKWGMINKKFCKESEACYDKIEDKILRESQKDEVKENC